MTRARHTFLALLTVALLTGCISPTQQDQGNQAGPTLPTPMVSLSTEVQGTLSLIQQALTPVGLQLQPPTQPYRPSEPPGLVTAPRAIQRESLAEPDLGYVVVYELPDQQTASARARELAAYLASGFGQTNYPIDAQFAISQVGDTVVFTWWSPIAPVAMPRPRTASTPSRRSGSRTRREVAALIRGPAVPRPNLCGQTGPRSTGLATRPIPDRQRRVAADPVADHVAPDLERVRAREVRFGPEAPAVDALVLAELALVSLTIRSISAFAAASAASSSGSGLGTSERTMGIDPGGSTTASIRPGAVSSTTLCEMPWSCRAASMSSGNTFSPLGSTMMFLIRPERTSRPFSSQRAMSPVWYQPSASSAAAVASGSRQ